MLPLLLDKPPRFSLDMSGVLGLVGGYNVVSAMVAVQAYGDKRWVGWYNNPGSFQIFKQLDWLAKSARAYRGKASMELLFEGSGGVRADPAVLFKPVAYERPKFRAAHSGTIIEQTGYLAVLFMKECTTSESKGKEVQGRRTRPVDITIADLSHTPPSAMRHLHANASARIPVYIPITVSIGACALCAVCGDWYASLLILVGIIASGVSCLVLGSADVEFTHPEPAKGSPAGDGILTSEKGIVLLRGTEGAVNSITRGQFSLRFTNEDHYTLVRWCSALFLVQCISQLLLISQASLFGQVMFLASLGFSWRYNWEFSSLDGEKINGHLLFSKVLKSPKLAKYTLGTRTAAVVFILLALRPQDPTKLLDELLPNDTEVWKQWKAIVLEQFRRFHDDDQALLSFESKPELAPANEFTDQERGLLGVLCGDAQAAYDGYRDLVQTSLQ